MTDLRVPGYEWTTARVETRLIAAFRVMPSCPVYGVGKRIKTLGDGRNGLTEVLEWASFLDMDANARKYLWAWARCQATRRSFSALCRDMGWKQATAERGRRRGAAAIARCLNDVSKALDSEKDGAGRSIATATIRVCVDA